MVTKCAPQVDGRMDGWMDATWTILLAQLTLSAELKTPTLFGQKQLDLEGNIEQTA
jgi:hypothetical protein